MKKLITILVLGMLVMSASAQLTLKSKSTVNLSQAKFSFNITGTTADSVGVYQDSLEWPIYISSIDTVTTYIRAKITEVTSPANITCQHQGKRFSTDSWTTLESKTYTGVGADTTLKFWTETTQRSFPYQRLLFIRNGNKAYVSSVSGWIFK